MDDIKDQIAELKRKIALKRERERQEQEAQTQLLREKEREQIQEARKDKIRFIVNTVIKYKHMNDKHFNSDILKQEARLYDTTWLRAMDDDDLGRAYVKAQKLISEHNLTEYRYHPIGELVDAIIDLHIIYKIAVVAMILVYVVYVNCEFL